jgi:ketosteroid isomerase-like protein
MRHPIALAGAVGVLSLSVMSALSPRNVASLADDRADVLAARDSFAAAFERGDAAALRALTTADIELYVPGQPDLRGADAVDQAARQMFAAVRFSNVRSERTEIDLVGSPASPRKAYELTLYTQTVHPTAANAQSSSVRGRALRVWEKGTDGKWRVSRNLYNWQ